jgi:hypothetical protein
VALRMEGEEGSCSAATPAAGSQQQQIRVVRCPKCDKLLPELTNYSVYVCGGCGATLQGLAFSPSMSSCDCSALFLLGVITFYISFLTAFRRRFLLVVNQRFSRPSVNPLARNPLDTISRYDIVMGSWELLLLGWAVSWHADVTSSFRRLLSFQDSIFYLFYSAIIVCILLSIYLVGLFHSSIDARAVKCFLFVVCLSSLLSTFCVAFGELHHTFAVNLRQICSFTP